MPRMIPIPPGMEFNHVMVPDDDMDGDLELNEDGSGASDPPIWKEIMRFFTNPRKPMILVLARPDPKKNITNLVRAFGKCRPLRELANLTLIMGNSDNIDEMSSTNAVVLTSILKLVDKYDLYGSVAYPKHHKQSDVPDIYRLAARTKGVFINPAFIEPFGLTLIEAAANGLPIVATKNGGPVDIHKVLDNGILVDRHDQNAIADALYKLVSDKQLWLQCRQNGLKNIYQFSWPEHCKKYILRVTSLKLRHPPWKKTVGSEGSESDDSTSSDSRDIQDLTLNVQLSLNGEKVVCNVDNVVGAMEDCFLARNNLENAAMKLSGFISPTKKENYFSDKLSLIRKRKNIIVIAIDSVSSSSNLVNIIKNIFGALAHQRSSGSVGFVVATSISISSIHSLLVAGGLICTDFDAIICNSGGDIYYPSYLSDDALGIGESPFAVDLDYRSQIEYRWGGEGLRKTLVHWVETIIKEAVVENIEESSPFCFAFNVLNPEIVPPVKELRKLMRIHALRCHVLYSHNGSRLNVIPVLASRYLYVRWGIQLTNMVVCVGESGDTDYEALLRGIHKTLILKGPFNTVGSQLHADRSYPLQDVVAFDNPNIVQVQGCGTTEILSGLQKLGMIMA